jgi:hypothetical protein
MENLKKLPLWKSILLFALPSAYFITLTKWFTPFLHKDLGVHPSLSWYITGYLVFIPLFIRSFISMGAIWWISTLLSKYYSFPPLQTTPNFMSSQPLLGMQKLLLLIWLPMFFFNIVGEQMLWHGYILPRQELTHGQMAWLVNALCWLLFHVCFGVVLIILLLPLLVIVPYTIQKTENTVTGLIVHAIVYGPMAVVIALGFIK